MVICDVEELMNERIFKATWLVNVSVALVVVGGFQPDMPLSLRVLALAIAAIAYVRGIKKAREKDKC